MDLKGDSSLNVPPPRNTATMPPETENGTATVNKMMTSHPPLPSPFTSIASRLTCIAIPTSSFHRYLHEGRDGAVQQLCIRGGGVRDEWVPCCPTGQSDDAVVGGRVAVHRYLAAGEK